MYSATTFSVLKKLVFLVGTLFTETCNSFRRNIFKEAKVDTDLYNILYELQNGIGNSPYKYCIQNFYIPETFNISNSVLTVIYCTCAFVGITFSRSVFDFRISFHGPKHILSSCHLYNANGDLG